MAVNAAWPGVSRNVMSLPFEAHLVGADMLSDAAGFPGNDIGFADGVQKRRLAVVDMAHDRDHRRPQEHGFDRIGLLLENVLGGLDGGDLGLDSVFIGKEHGRIRVHGLVLRGHDAHGHKLFHDVADLLPHHLGEFLDRAAFLDLDDLFPRLGDIRHIGLLRVAIVLLMRLLARRKRLEVGQLLEGRFFAEFALLFLLELALLLPFLLGTLARSGGRGVGSWPEAPGTVRAPGSRSSAGCRSRARQPDAEPGSARPLHLSGMRTAGLRCLGDLRSCGCAVCAGAAGCGGAGCRRRSSRRGCWRGCSRCDLQRSASSVCRRCGFCLAGRRNNRGRRNDRLRQRGNRASAWYPAFRALKRTFRSGPRLFSAALPWIASGSAGSFPS